MIINGIDWKENCFKIAAGILREHFPIAPYKPFGY